EFVYPPCPPETVKEVQLFASADEGKKWAQVGTSPPDEPHFLYFPEKDGLYWLTAVAVGRDGSRAPADLTTAPPDEKKLVDTTPPRVKVTGFSREGRWLNLEWTVEEENPSTEEVRVWFWRIDPLPLTMAFGEVRVPAGTRKARVDVGT